MNDNEQETASEKLGKTLVLLYASMSKMPRGDLEAIADQLDRLRRKADSKSVLKNASFRTLIELVEDMKAERG